MKKLIKTGFIIGFSLVLVLSFAACGSSEDESAESLEDAAVSDTQDPSSYAGGRDGQEIIDEVMAKAATEYKDLDELKGFWQICACRSVLGEDAVQAKSFDLSDESPDQPGVFVLAFLIMGTDPSDYEGHDYLEDLKAMGAEGEYTVPIFNLMAWNALDDDTASLDAETEDGLISKCINLVMDLSMGPDMGGWALAALRPYMDHDIYGEQIKAAADYYVETVGSDMAGESMGSPGITYSCVCLGLTALADSGREGCDVAFDEPWLSHNPLGLIYDNIDKGEENVTDYYNSQYYFTISELKHVQDGEGMTWNNL